MLNDQGGLTVRGIQVVRSDSSPISGVGADEAAILLHANAVV